MTAVYEAGHIKRKRSTKTEMAERYGALINIVTDAAPTGVRFCYYRAVSQGIVPKTNNGYVLVQRALMHLRETGIIPWGSITDSSRWMRRPDTWDGVDGLLRDMIDLSRMKGIRVDPACRRDGGTAIFEKETNKLPTDATKHEALACRASSLV